MEFLFWYLLLGFIVWFQYVFRSWLANKHWNKIGLIRYLLQDGLGWLLVATLLFWVVAIDTFIFVEDYSERYTSKES